VERTIPILFSVMVLISLCSKEGIFPSEEVFHRGGI